ncbi:MAG: DUF5916 domain-containing protein, partial [Vicinamibacterales bacterium]
MSSADGLQISGQVEYQQTTPGRYYREYSFTVGQTQEWNYGGDRQTAQMTTKASLTWPNFWDTEFSTVHNFRRQDMRLTRGGPTMEAPAGWETTLHVETSDAAQTQAHVTTVYGRTEDSGLTFSTELGATVRPAPQWQLSITPKYVREVDTQQYISTLSGGSAATYGNRYIFGEVDRSTYSTQIRLNYTFKPDLNLDLYAEPFAASGHY